jgi:hypothetical protein
MTPATATFTLATFGYKVTQTDRFRWKIEGLGESVEVGEHQFIEIARATPDKPYHEQVITEKYQSPIEKVLG